MTIAPGVAESFLLHRVMMMRRQMCDRAFLVIFTVTSFSCRLAVFRIIQFIQFFTPAEKKVQHTSALLGSRLLCEATITQEMIAVAGSDLPAGLHACGLATAGRRAPWAACGRHGEARAKHLLLGEAARGCRGCGDPAASARTVRCSPARLACLRGAPRAAPRPSWSRRRLS